VIRAVDMRADLLRASIASPANDHRLGANEAPPAIMSIFLGDMLTDILNQVENGTPKKTKSGGALDLGATTLPQIPRHASDRNRTSPFAFTGNKFEFRAVGSTASVAWPNTVLNTIVAESLDYMATELERKAGKNPSEAKLETAVKAVLKDVLKKHRRVCFDGDGYSEAWHREAARRGLPNLPSTADCLGVFASKSAKDLFAKYGVLSPRELEARHDVLVEHYNTVLAIEGRTLVQMVRTQVLPAALRAQEELASAVSTTLAADVDCADTQAELKSYVAMVDELRASVRELETLAARHHKDEVSEMRFLRDHVVPAMARIRAACDALERVTPADLWPMPTYAEMLLMK
jgi:glutamine synthetase